MIAPWLPGFSPASPSLVRIMATLPPRAGSIRMVRCPSLVWILATLPLHSFQPFPPPHARVHSPWFAARSSPVLPWPAETFPTIGSFPYRFHARHYRPVFAPFCRLGSNMDKLSWKLSDRPHRAHISLPGLSCAAVPRIFSPVCFPGSHLDL